LIESRLDANQGADRFGPVIFEQYGHWPETSFWEMNPSLPPLLANRDARTEINSF
jgi:hypothetical protein